MSRRNYDSDHFIGIADSIYSLMVDSSKKSEEKKQLLSINLALHQAAAGIMDRLDRIIELLEKQKTQ